MQQDYSPFDKLLGALEAKDLADLRNAAEGWYIEYKREVSNAGAIAKSISAFANTYGGWLFYGIAEKSKDEPVAGQFEGILSTDADAALQRIRQAAAMSVQPSPYFETKVLFGPEPSIGLAADRCIVAVRIPWGSDAPHVHRDGRIYRRVTDGSEPRPETDRYIIDQLSARSARTEAYYEAWINQRLETSKGEDDAAFIRVFLIADFWGDRPPVNDVELGVVRKIMQDTQGEFNVPLSNVYRSADGFVCRQANSDNPEQLSLTWKVLDDFRSEIIIPLTKINGANLVNLRGWLEGYDHADRFVESCRRQNYRGPAVIDLNIFLVVLIGLARKHAALAKEFGWAGTMLAKVRVSGVWRTVPFFDAPHVLDEYERHGIPLSLADNATIYQGKRRNSFFEIPSDSSDEMTQFPNLLMAIHLFAKVAVGLGVSITSEGDGPESDLSTAISAFVMAGQRAITAQKHRSRRQVS